MVFAVAAKLLSSMLLNTLTGVENSTPSGY